MVDKLEYIVYIRGMRTETCQNAQLALFQRRPDEAERILLQVSDSITSPDMISKLALCLSC